MPTAAGPALLRPAPVTAGISASLTGQFATQGRQALAGLAAWVEYVNGPGGGGILLDGRRHPVTLRHYDDGSRAAAARRNTERLLDDDGVDLLFGPYSAGLTTAAAAVAAARARLLWNHGGAGDAVYDLRAGCVVGILAPARRYLAGLPALARSAHPDARTLAIARVDAGAFARQVSHGSETAARALGFDTILHLTYPPDTADFAGIAAQIAAAAPDVLVAVGRIRHDIALARALDGAGFPPGHRVGGGSRHAHRRLRHRSGRRRRRLRRPHPVGTANRRGRPRFRPAAGRRHVPAAPGRRRPFRSGGLSGGAGFRRRPGRPALPAGRRRCGCRRPVRRRGGRRLHHLLRTLPH